MKVTVSRKAHFNAAHRLHIENWSDKKNTKIFGKCSNPNYHGHNYELIVSLTGEIDPVTDMVIDLKDLSHLTSSTRFSFGSSQRLFENLGVFPGAVSPFCMLNGKKNGVKLFFDSNFKKIKNIYLHPFVNDRTVKMNFNDLVKFLYEYKIDINWINI